MSNPTGRYLCSEETLLKVESYLKSLIAGTTKAGARLAKVLSDVKIDDVSTINAKQLLAFLMDTRKPKIFAESEPTLDGSDWNLQENAILGDIVFSTTGTKAYNNGAHSNQQDHILPLDTHFLFIASALLRNDPGNMTSDMKDVLVNGKLDEKPFYKLYERRLLPGLLIQNEQAKKDGTPLVINIPGLGCGQFAGNYEDEVRAALPRVLKKLFETHGAKLDMVRTVNYDPFKTRETDEFTTDKIPNTQIRLMNRPSLGLPEGASGKVASQLEFPKDGTDYTNFRLIKIVAWDHFSFPGNDIWVNDESRGNGRATDDGVSFASSDVVLALFEMGQFGSNLPDIQIKYNSKQGIAYAINPENNKELGYKELAKLYPSHVTVEMIDVITTLGVVLTQSPEKIQKKISDFENTKGEIQKQFMTNLTTLKLELDNKSTQNNTPSKLEGERLHSTLLKNQEEFFQALALLSTEEELNAAITDFRKSCQENIEIADKIMGHGWLYRIVEVLIKAVVGLFAGVGMVLGSLVGQGLFKAEHRQKFSNAFFTLNQTDESQALDKFKQAILGDEKEEPGLLPNLNFR